MGLYYRLSNGEYIEIRTESGKAEILLFNGTITLTYDLDINTTLNNIIEEIERDYSTLQVEDLQFQIYSNYD